MLAKLAVLLVRVMGMKLKPSRTAVGPWKTPDPRKW